MGVSQATGVARFLIWNEETVVWSVRSFGSGLPTWSGHDVGGAWPAAPGRSKPKSAGPLAALLVAVVAHRLPRRGSRCRPTVLLGFLHGSDESPRAPLNLSDSRDV